MTDLNCFICKRPIKTGDKFRAFENNNLLQVFQAQGETELRVEALEITHDINKQHRINICEECFKNYKE